MYTPDIDDADDILNLYQKILVDKRSGADDVGTILIAVVLNKHLNFICDELEGISNRLKRGEI